MPELRKILNLPDLRLQVVGIIQSAPSLQAFDGERIDLCGRVDDLKALFEAARLIVVPTRYAAGIPHKAHHVASLGIPMVATDLIAEQLGWMNGRDLLSSSDAKVFAKHCAQLYTNSELWKKVRGSAVERVEEECSPEAFRKTIRDVVSLAS